MIDATLLTTDQSHTGEDRSSTRHRLACIQVATTAHPGAAAQTQCRPGSGSVTLLTVSEVVPCPYPLYVVRPRSGINLQVMPSATPTIEDARRAAEALTNTGVGRVVLFGSVAHGAATERSDIDLIAIYDDIDYSRRREIATPAQSIAKDAAGFPVDVVVTDRPEWKMRTTQVLTSLEARAARVGTVLVDRPEGIVDWNKEMVMPADDHREALYGLDHVSVALEDVLERLKPGTMHARYTELGWLEEAGQSEVGRMLTLGGSCQAVAEAALKALIHLTA